MVDKTDKQFVDALEIAKKAVNGDLIDYTNGATHYHTKKISPKWAAVVVMCCAVKS